VTIQLTLEQIQAIQTHAEAIYPEECCGLLLGHREPQRNAKQVIEVWPTENSWSPTLAIDDVAVDQGRTQDLRSWCLDDDHNFQPEAIARQPQA